MKKMIGLGKIEQVGGPAKGTMTNRIRSGLYPNAVKNARGQWEIPAQDAIDTVAEWMAKKDLVPLSSVGRQCGLSNHSLNARLDDGMFKATCIKGRWFVSSAEAQKLVEYHRDSVTTTEAAHILGFTHRRSMHNLIARGFPFVMLGKTKKIRKSDLRRYQNGELGLGRASPLPAFAKKLGFNLAWGPNRQEICPKITYSLIYQGDDETLAAITCAGRQLCTMPLSKLNRTFQNYIYRPTDARVCDGEIHIVLHELVRVLFENRAALTLTASPAKG